LKAAIAILLWLIVMSYQSKYVAPLPIVEIKMAYHLCAFRNRSIFNAFPRMALSDKSETVSFSSNLNPLGYAKTAPLGKSGGKVQLEN
jgi:hypothetical protein